MSTLEGLKVFALGEGHRGVSSVGVLEYASGLRFVVCVFDSDRRLHRSSSPVSGLRQRLADYVCILIDQPDKDQHLYPKRCRSFPK